MRRIRNFVFLNSILIIGIACSKETPEPQYISYKTFNGIYSYNNITSIAIDSLGNKWIGTVGGGVSVFDGTNWTTYYTKDGLASNTINAIAVDSKNNKWFCTMGGGVSKFDGTTWTTYNTTNGLLNDSVYSIALDTRGNKWFGYNYHLGISEFNDYRWTTYDSLYTLDVNNIKNGFPYQILAMTADNQGNVWFLSIESNIIFKFDGSNWNYLVVSKGSSGSIAIDKKSNIWVGGYGEITKYNGSDWTIYSFGANKFIPCIALDTAGNPWIGSMGSGVLKFDGTHWKIYNTSNGLINNDVHTLAIDKLGNVWIGTSNGISELLN